MPDWLVATSIGLAGRKHHLPFRLAVTDSDCAVGIEVHYRIIRQATSQLFAVSCLEVQCCYTVGAEECWMGLTFHLKNKPRLNTTHAAIVTAAVTSGLRFYL